MGSFPAAQFLPDSVLVILLNLAATALGVGSGGGTVVLIGA